MIKWTKKEWEEACGWKEDEHYLVLAIKKFLLTESQREELFALNCSIEDLLNGRCGDIGQEEKFFNPWNEKLGWKEFGY